MWRLPVSVARQVHFQSIIDSVPTAVYELLRNSVEALATRVEIVVDMESLSVAVVHNGRGFDSAARARL